MFHTIWTLSINHQGSGKASAYFYHATLNQHNIGWRDDDLDVRTVTNELIHPARDGGDDKQILKTTRLFGTFHDLLECPIFQANVPSDDCSQLLSHSSFLSSGATPARWPRRDDRGPDGVSLKSDSVRLRTCEIKRRQPIARINRWRFAYGSHPLSWSIPDLARRPRTWLLCWIRRQPAAA